MQSLTTSSWFRNHLLDSGFLARKADELKQKPIAYDLAAWLDLNFQADQFAVGNEAQLESSFIAPLLKQLGWQAVPQQSLTVQGKIAKPDWCLALHSEQGQQLIAHKSHEFVTAICEAKAWGLPLDTGKANKDNPHHQLQDYLSTLRVRFGFLTNGQIWRFYDTDKITAKKTYIEFDLQQVCALAASEEKDQALALFAFFFGRDTYTQPTQTDQRSAIEQTLAQAHDFAFEVEENLKAVIYGYAGEESLFEVMGKAIYKANAKRQVTLDAVYENSVILLFRLLFVVYLEDKSSELLEHHPFYKKYSLKTLYQNLCQPPMRSAQRHDGIYELRQLFERLDEGAQEVDIPLFNGGLFDPARAPLLLTPRIFDNLTLQQILEKLLFKSYRGDTLFDTRRDFKNMSVTHLGRIYEGLLEFRFERAQEPATYLEYESTSTKGKTVEAYFDAYDAANVRKEKGFKVLREQSVKKGEVYLKSANNSRKTSASYYTPSALSERLVQAGIDRAISSGRPLVSLKVLDNACGSGHFLVQALNHLTDLALQALEHNAELTQLVQEERLKIAEQLQLLNLGYEPDDAQILKRALLKRCIYGLDLNPFAVELARLSLWMDSFIFGTPLSFIEHHIQHGNALVGASVQDLIDYNVVESTQNDLFVEDLGVRFDELRSVMHELDAMRDTTAEEIAQSKELWKSHIEPKLKLLGRALSFISTRHVLLAEGRRDAVQTLDTTPDLLKQLFDANKTRTDVLKQLEDCATRYRFFHYEVAFPEAFANERKGFDVIVGNPPWDKTKFADTDFFPQYCSNYRSLKNTEKTAVQQRLLGSAHIKTAYEQTQRSMEVTNELYKAAYPLNRGAGDGNLFRFFVERNLALLAPGGSLNYVLPSALMFEVGSLALRQHILTHCQMLFFYSFENRKGIFQDVHRSYKFALMQVVNTPPAVEKNGENAVIDTAFYVLDPAELEQAERHVPYPLQTLKTLSPQQWALMELRDALDLPILERCYGTYASLSPDWLDFRRELDMTNDKNLFLEKQAPGLLPLFEGEMIWQFSHMYADAGNWLVPDMFDECLRSKELHRMAQDMDVPKAQVAQYADAVYFDREFVRLGVRALASDTNERTLICALLPKGCGVGNSMNVSIPKTYRLGASDGIDLELVSGLRLLFVLAWFNSLVVDWMLRQMVQLNVNKTYLYRLPMPQPSDEEILRNPSYKQLAKNALLLTLAASWDDFASDLNASLQALGVQRQDVPTSAKACDQLRAQNDQLVAQLYGISAGELGHVLKSFKGMANKRPEYVALLTAAP